MLSPITCSEHQTGLALDVSCPAVSLNLSQAFSETAEGRWLARHAPLYGFIIRYPKDKTKITGYSYEPWHIRYVGKNLAKYLYKNNLTLEEYYKIVDKYGIKDTCCICPMKSRGSTSTKKLNDIIREKLNPIPADRANIPSVKDSEFRLNDRVMLTKNTRNAEGATRMLVNGDLGFITDIRWVQRKVTVTFDDGERGIFEFSEFCRKFELAYASTIHKCQGQEYKAVVIPCSGEHYIMLQKNLLYTAVTRAKKECILIGGKKYIKMAAENEAAAQRYTMLAWRINHNVLAAHI